MNDQYSRTIRSCYIGYVVQAIGINFAPLLFVQFGHQYGLHLSDMTWLVSVNFIIQLLTDASAIPIIRFFGYRKAAVVAHFIAVIGLMSLMVLPEVLGNAFIGLFISTLCYAIGGGMIEVVLSPIVDACPSENKEQAMSLLHSFYSWGWVLTVLVSSIFFALVGIEHWKWLAGLFALVPLYNAFQFMRVPIAEHLEDEGTMRVSSVVRVPMFWLFALFMFCAGASEMAIGQWVSVFVETGIGLPKVMGDLAGAMMFGITMGTARTFFGSGKHGVSLVKFMVVSLVMGIIATFCMALPLPAIVQLVGCALYGGAVGILWPGTYSMAADVMPKGGSALFGLLALAGDIGCTVGPVVVGSVATWANDTLSIGIAVSVVFMLLLLGALFVAVKKGWLTTPTNLMT